MPSPKSDHIPRGNPCRLCNLPPHRHRVEHEQQGHTCAICGVYGVKHRDRGYRDFNLLRLKEKAERRRGEKRIDKITYIGIDGEGQGREDHRYNLLAASNENGSRKWHVEALPKGCLSTVDCLEMILSLPTKRSKIFSFSFNYDLTKMLTDLDNESLYKLFRPELRQRHGPDAFKGPISVKWGAYLLNLQGTKFTVRKRHKRVVIWDLFKFFQGKFVTALRDWKVGSEALWTRMGAMKEQRAVFDEKMRAEIRAYCFEETRCIAELARRMIEAHQTVGLKLKTYYGAGSSGGAMLDKMGIRKVLAPTPVPMKEAVAAAFFGGRFENSVVGTVPDVLYNYDISSAYPYATTFLPCLVHASWTHSKNIEDVEKAPHALVKYKLGKNPGHTEWGPFPFRTLDGSIAFPIESGGGWVWKDEFLEGAKLFSHVDFCEAWIYSSQCDCQPFAKIPEFYNLRLKIGKEGPGIVIKLGVNSCYGKLAQSVGNALFNSWIWAGMITSKCRSQILQMLGLHKDRRNLLMIATDGIYTREKLNPPAPIETNTGNTGKPLGGWEEKICTKGMFVARPGIYFPLRPTKEEIKEIRGRGVGKGVVLEHSQKIIDAWNAGGIDAVARVPNVSRFCGAKTCISVSKSKSGKLVYKRARGAKGKPSYGQWIERKVELTFDPMPKREKVSADGMTLVLRKFPLDQKSVPYDRAMRSRESLELAAAMLEALEQPDADLSEYDYSPE